MGRNMLRPYAEGRGELGEEQGVAGAAAGDDELVDLGFGQDETVERVNDGQGGENSGGTDEVGGLRAMAAAEGEEFLHVSVTVVFAASRFGRGELQVGIAHQFIEKRGETAAL